MFARFGVDRARKLAVQSFRILLSALSSYCYSFQEPAASKLPLETEMSYLVVYCCRSFCSHSSASFAAENIDLRGKISTAVDDGGAFSRVQACSCILCQGPSQRH